MASSRVRLGDGLLSRVTSRSSERSFGVRIAGQTNAVQITNAVSRALNGDSDDAPNALDLLKSDHREVEELFEQALSDETPAAEKRRATAKIVDALTLHARMEEVLFYPELRAAGGREERDSVLEAAEEHGMVKDMIAKIKRSVGRDETMKAKLTVLKEMVMHHVKEEESEIFDEARRVLGDDRLEELGARMARFKERGGTGGARGGSRNGARKKSSGGGGRKSPTRKAAGRKTASRKAAGKKTASRKKTTRKGR